jgi:2-polyprenyl-6-hydroxyphenyl methylase/3-demethylubiquinone-9 3-methyltransferase
MAGRSFHMPRPFSFQIATDTQAETDRYWNAIVSNGGEESACDWCKDCWGISWQITPRVFAAMMEMGKIDIAKIEAARRG